MVHFQSCLDSTKCFSSAHVHSTWSMQHLWTTIAHWRTWGAMLGSVSCPRTLKHVTAQGIELTIFWLEVDHSTSWARRRFLTSCQYYSLKWNWIMTGFFQKAQVGYIMGVSWNKAQVPSLLLHGDYGEPFLLLWYLYLFANFSVCFRRLFFYPYNFKSDPDPCNFYNNTSTKT